ncbi:MAG: transposase [Candidatus Saccharibacteria bacterium]
MKGSGKVSLMDLYTDYLMVSTSLCTATGLSRLTDGIISHDRITRLLSCGQINSSEVWQKVKPFIRHIENSQGCLSIDDSIQGKPYTDESALICWHFDHVKNKSVKGVNFISANYCYQGGSLPVAVDFVRKPVMVTDKKTGKPRRKSEKTKNQMYRELLQVAMDNEINFGYVLNDTWFSSAENMCYVRNHIKTDFVMAVKDNRNVAMSHQDKLEGKYIKIGALEPEPCSVMEVWFEQVDFPVLLTRQVFKNEDGSHGILYLVSSDLDLTYEQITAIYQKRWKVEQYHKSIKSNASFAKSPTKAENTQLGHFYASILAYVKYEVLKFVHGSNHFALKSTLYMAALKAAYEQLKKYETISIFQVA